MTEGLGPRVLVTDAVPMNGGDELLLRALLRSLHDRWGIGRVQVMTHAVAASRALMPDVHFVGDASVDADGARQAYHDADVIISTPGGFLSRHYGTARLSGMRLAAAVGRPFAIYGQSIGPFDSDSQRREVGEVLSKAARVAVRDAASVAQVLACGVPASTIVQVVDASFLWPARAAVNDRNPHRPVARVGLGLRRWPRSDTTAFRETVRKTRRLMRMLAARGVDEFLFVSTCQGVSGYTDDSDLSARVLEGLEPDLARRTRVVGDRLHPDAFMDLVGTCDLYVGMRLHACLMAMQAGTPAVGLRYELKTAEIFDQMGLGAHQLSFTEDASRWGRRVVGVLDDIARHRTALPGRVASMRTQAGHDLAVLDPLLGPPLAAHTC